jgi:hypothetical protein
MAKGRFGVTVTCCVLLTIVIMPAASGQPLQKINTCFEESIAALRLSQLDQLIDLCDKVVSDAATKPETRGQALAQRGLGHFRRWAVLETAHDATRGISDITEGLRLHTPVKERRQQLLLIRAQLYAATGQLRRASDDYRLVLSEDPTNDTARTGLRKIGAPESN